MLKQGVAGDHQLVQNLLVAPVLEHQAEDLLLPPGQVAGMHQFLQAPGLGLLLLGPAGHGVIGIVQMVGEGAEGKGLLLGKVPFRLGAVEGEQGHHLVVIGEVQGHGVADVIGGVEVPVDQGVLPVRRALAAPDHQGLWCVAHPQALVLVVPLDPQLLQLAKGFRQAEGVPVEDLPGVGINLHLHQTGIGAGDQQLHLGQDGALQVVHVLTGVDVVDNFVIKQKKILVHGPPPFRQTRLRQRTCVPFYCPPPAKSRASPSFFSTYKREASYCISTTAYPFLLD